MMTNKPVIYLLLLFINILAGAQENIDTPASMFGIGDIQLWEGGRTAGMASTSMAVSGRYFLNTTNPAALAKLDSTNFILDITGSVRHSSFSYRNQSEKAFSGNVARVTAGLNFTPRWSGAITLQPYSVVSYDIDKLSHVEGAESEVTTNYEGIGGVNRLSLLNSFRLGRNFSIGADLMVLFGNIERNALQNGVTINETALTNNLSYALGMYYDKKITQLLNFSAGVIYRQKTNLIFDNELNIFNSSGEMVYSGNPVSTRVEIPASYGAGFSLSGNKIRFAADYLYREKLSMYGHNSDQSFANTHKLNAGLAFTPGGKLPTSYLEAVEFQAGFLISNSYLRQRNANPFNFEFTTGAGLPIQGGSQINLGFSWGRDGAPGYNLIQENYFRFTVGVSLVERMFVKLKYY